MKLCRHLLVIVSLWHSNFLFADDGESRFRGVELRTAPIALLADWYTLDVSLRLTEHFAAGPSLVIYDSAGRQGNMLMPTYSGRAYGIHFVYYFAPVAVSGWYAGARGYAEHYFSYPEGSLGYEKVSGARADVVLGYRLKWSRWQIMMGGGLEYGDHRVERLGSASGSGSIEHRSGWGPAFEVKIGLEI